MPKPRKSRIKSSNASVRGDGGKNRVDPGIGLSKAALLDARQVNKLTSTYKQAAERKWFFIQMSEIEAPLNEVYVMLQAMADPPPSRMMGGQRSGLARLAQGLRLNGNEMKDGRLQPLRMSQILKEAQHLTLLGEPGSGKSTSLQFIGLCFAKDSWARTELQLIEKRVPIRLDLGEYAKILIEPGPAMEHALNRTVREFLRDLDEEQVRMLIRLWRDQGSLLILLDGLDEVPEEHRAAVRDEIKNFALSDTNGRCRLIVSSRVAGYTPLGGTFHDFTIQPFERSEESVPFLQKLLASLCRDWSLEQAQTEAIQLHKQMVAQPVLNRVLENPLLLQIAGQIYATDRRIVLNRADLYSRYIEDLWIRAVEERHVSGIGKEDVWKALEELAWALQMDTPMKVSLEMSSVLCEKMGLGIQVGEQLVFSHTTLQEYFVSKRLVHAFQRNPEGAWAFLRPRIHVDAWREPLLLLCGSLETREASELIQRVLGAGSPYEHSLYRDKLLAASLLAENPQIENAIRKKVVGCLLLMLGDPRASTPAMNTLFRIGNAVIAELIQALKDRNNNERVQWNIADALERIQAAQVVPDFIREFQNKNNDTFIRRAMLRALGEMKAVEAVPDLIQALRDQDNDSAMRRGIVQALGKMKAVEAVPDLIQALRNKDESSDVRQTTARALREICAAQAVPYLSEILEDQDQNLLSVVAQELANIEKPLIPDSNHPRAERRNATEAGFDQAREFNPDQSTEDAQAMPIPIERKKCQRQLSHLRKMIASKPGYESELRLAQQIALLEASLSPYQDPLEALKPSSIRKVLRVGPAIFGIVALLGMLAVLYVLFGAAQDTFKKMLVPSLTQWIIGNPSAAVVAFIVLAIVIGLLAWWLDKTKSAFSGRK